MIALAEKFSNIITNNKGAQEIKLVLDSLSWFQSLMSGNKMFYRVMISPIVENNQKIALINKIAKASKFELENISSNLIVMLLKLGRIKILNDIILSLRKKELKEKNINDVSIYFASAPSEKQITTVTSLLVQRYHLNPEVKIIVDANVIAGFIAFFDGKMLDASLHIAFDDIANLTI